jgi:squalene-associated FAD-dependent desaturase
MAGLDPQRPAHPLAVIGGGWAGMTAAAELALHGHQVLVFEAGKTLGGRARAVERHGLMLDNGQHLLIGAYQSTLGMLSRLGVAEHEVLQRMPLHLTQWPQLDLKAPRLPAPLHLVAALLRARGLSWRSRIAMLQLMQALQRSDFRLPATQTVAGLLAQHRQPLELVQAVWEPLTLAALNTPLASASAQILAHVLRDSLLGCRSASDFLLPRVDLTRVLPAAAARCVTLHGGRVLTGHAVQQLQMRADGWLVHTRQASYPVAGVILAVGPHQLGTLGQGLPDLQALADRLAQWSYEPIYTVYLHYPDTVRLPLPMLGLDASYTAQWLFDRGQLNGQAGLMAGVISASGPHTALDHRTLAARVHADLCRIMPGLPAPNWQQVIAEQRATFACQAGLQRPGHVTAYPHLYLAGDYTDGPYPATLEGAVRSGQQAALALHDSVQSAAPCMPE